MPISSKRMDERTRIARETDDTLLQGCMSAVSVSSSAQLIAAATRSGNVEVSR